MSRIPSLAVRNVARNRRRSGLTLAAIVVGVAAAILLRGMVDGFVELMIDAVVETRSGALQVHRAGYFKDRESKPLHLNLPDGGELVAKMRAVPGVKAVTGRIHFSGLISNGRSQTMFVGRAVDVFTERKVCPNVDVDIDAGGVDLTPGDQAAGVLGVELAKSFGAVPRAVREAAVAQNAPEAETLVDTVSLSAVSPEGRANAMDVTVKGRSTSGFVFDNKRVVTLPLAFAQELLGMQGKVTEFAVAVEDLRDLDRVRADLATALGPEVEVHTWADVEPFFRDVTRIQRYILGLISLVLFVIVLTVIANTMLMSVFERVREIGTMLACGVRRSQVLSMFVVEAVTLGLLGGVLGVVVGRLVVGVLGNRGIPMKLIGAAQPSQLRPVADPEYMFYVAVGALVGTAVAAAYPAWKASRLNPVDALRAT